MRQRAYQTFLCLLVIAGVLSLSGCKLILAKLKKKKPVNTDDTPTLSASNDIEAVNKDQVARFPDERRLFNEVAFVRTLSFARTGPNEGGTIVSLIDANTVVTKHANRFGSTLITFTRSGFPGQRFAGWVPDAAFFFQANTPPPPPPPPPGGGTCSMTLRTSGFTPSKPTCSFNETVRSGPATLFFPCSGGSATARFSTQTFSGSADRGRVAITNSSTSTFSGCTIRTTQSIAGTPPSLSYFLSETIVSGTCKGINTCTARATITAVQ